MLGLSPMEELTETLLGVTTAVLDGTRALMAGLAAYAESPEGKRVIDGTRALVERLAAYAQTPEGEAMLKAVEKLEEQRLLPPMGNPSMALYRTESQLPSEDEEEALTDNPLPLPGTLLN
jgi:hypothetical protein